MTLPSVLCAHPTPLFLFYKALFHSSYKLYNRYGSCTRAAPGMFCKSVRGLKLLLFWKSFYIMPLLDILLYIDDGYRK